MSVLVLIPWRPSPGRQLLFRRVTEHLTPLGYPIHTADSDGPVFSLAQAFNQAANRPWDKAILSEADVIAPVANIVEALEWPGLTFCYDQHLRLDAHETSRYLKDGGIPARRPKPAGASMGFNGVRVIDRATWDRVGGYDERFVGWGGEDNDFYWRVKDSGAQVRRLPGVQVEMWHPRDRVYQATVGANRRLLAEKHPGRYL